jgi:hypothetical protein
MATATARNVIQTPSSSLELKDDVTAVRDDDRLLDARQVATFERHYRIAELCDLWGIGRETLRRILIDEPGVVRIRMGRRKYHTTYSVPASVAERIHARLASW